MQNRRSKERRLKQMRANGTYRASRRQRSSSSAHTDEASGSEAPPMPTYMGLGLYFKTVFKY